MTKPKKHAPKHQQNQQVKHSDSRSIKIMLIGMALVAVVTLFFGLKIDQKTLAQRIFGSQEAAKTIDGK
jgi:hypothetical protein